jgi:hypothetical protein
MVGEKIAVDMKESNQATPTRQHGEQKQNTKDIKS